MGVHGPVCLQAKLGPPPVSPLGVVPEARRKTIGFHLSFMNLIRIWMEENMSLIPWLAIVFTSWLDMSVIGPFVCGTHS